MDYRSNLKIFLMKGKMFRVKGQGIAGTGSLPQMRLSPAFREGGTISHRALSELAMAGGSGAHHHRDETPPPRRDTSTSTRHHP